MIDLTALQNNRIKEIGDYFLNSGEQLLNFIKNNSKVNYKRNKTKTKSVEMATTLGNKKLPPALTAEDKQPTYIPTTRTRAVEYIHSNYVMDSLYPKESLTLTNPASTMNNGKTREVFQELYQDGVIYYLASLVILIISIISFIWLDLSLSLAVIGSIIIFSFACLISIIKALKNN